MNTLKDNRSIIIETLTDYLNISHKYQNVKSKLIISEDRNDYLIFVYGRHDTEPVHECILHIQIEEDKIIIRRDNTTLDLFDKLLNAGISSHKIIYPDAPQREITDYTVSLEKIYELHSSLFEVKENFTKALKLDVTSAQLVELAAIEHEYLNCAIASHPNTPTDLLKDFFSKFPLQVLTNPIMDLLLLEQPKFIEKLYKKYVRFFKKNSIKDVDVNDLRKWATEKKQEDVTYDTSISNIRPTFLLEKTIDFHRHHIIQNLWKNSRLPLNTKNNPEETMRSLDNFLSSLFGDRQVEYKPDLKAIKARQLPLPLKYLYSFIGKYPGEHGEWLQTQDSLTDGTEIIREKRLFLVENQGVWVSGTELEGYDPPVWIEGDRRETWEYLCDSLSEFLVTFCLQEILLDSECKSLVSQFKKGERKVTFMWQGISAWNVVNFFSKRDNRRSCYYLVKDDI